MKLNISPLFDGLYIRQPITSSKPSPFSSHSSLVSLVLVWSVCQGRLPPGIQLHRQSSCGEDCLMGSATLSKNVGKNNCVIFL